jgi:flavin-dependent dehydrogenase
MFDLIIVGAGPSGSSAGRLAVRLGLETLLIEKKLFPRYKPCGGAVTEQAMSYLDFDLPEYICERSIFGGRLHFGSQSIERHTQDRIAVMVTRSVLDTYLLEKARETGIQIHLGERVVDYAEGQGAVEVLTDQGTYEARFVIIAEGALGRLKQRLRIGKAAALTGVGTLQGSPPDQFPIAADLPQAQHVCKVTLLFGGHRCFRLSSASGIPR